MRVAELALPRADRDPDVSGIDVAEMAPGGSAHHDNPDYHLSTTSSRP